MDSETGFIDYTRVRDVDTSASFALTVQSFPVTRQLEYPAPRPHHILRFRLHNLRLMVAIGPWLADVEGWSMFRCFGYGGNALLPAGRPGLARIPTYLIRPSGVLEGDISNTGLPLDALEQEWEEIATVYRWNVDMVFEMDFPHQTAGIWTEVPGVIFQDEVPVTPQRQSFFRLAEEVEVVAVLGMVGWWTIRRTVGTRDTHFDDVRYALGNTEDDISEFGQEPSGRVFRIISSDVLRNIGFRGEYVVSPVFLI